MGEGSAARKAGVYALGLLVALGVFSYVGLSGRQAIASTLVLALVLATVLFWEMRLSFALLGTAVLFATGLLTLGKFVEFASLNIILFLAGMMIVVAYLEKNAFFEYLVSRILLAFGGGGKRIFLILMVLAALFSALVDEVTSILFMLSIVLYLTAKLKVSPIPFVILTVFATNIGSSATAVGNPVGVVIALNAKLSFADFLANATPIASVALLVGMLAMYFYYRKEIDDFAAKAKGTPVREFIESQSTGQHTLASGLLFSGVVLFLLLHAQVEQALGLEKNTMLLGTALAAAGIVLLAEAQNARHFVETKIDWWTLLFFMMLFASVGALEQSGVMELAAKGFVSTFGGTRLSAMAAVMLLSGGLSAVLDNVLAVAVFVPLVHDLQPTALGGNYLWWALLFGATLFGNMTIIGSTANIVALGLVEKRGIRKIGFVEWLKPGAVIVLVTAATAFALLYFQHGLA